MLNQNFILLNLSLEMKWFIKQVELLFSPFLSYELWFYDVFIEFYWKKFRKIFGRFGRLLQVVLKRPPVNSGTFSAFAFIHFETVDMAFLAKKELSGQFFGRLQVRIKEIVMGSSNKMKHQNYEKLSYANNFF